MTEIRARLAPGRAIQPDTFADLTDHPAAATWDDDGRIVVTFAADLTPDAESAIRHRIVSMTAREELLRGEAETYLEQPEPSLTEIRAQVARLTEIVLGTEESDQ